MNKLVDFHDHFSLRRPSSSLTYRGESIYVVELRSSQVQMKITQPKTIAEKEGVVLVHHSNNNNDADGKINNEIIECEDAVDRPSYAPTNIEVKEVYYEKGERISFLRLTYTIVALYCMACVSFFVGVCLVGKKQRNPGVH